MANFADVSTNLNLNGGQTGWNIPTTGSIENMVFGGKPQYAAPTLDNSSATQIQNYQNGLLSTPQQNTQKIMAGTDAAQGVQDQSQAADNSNKEQGGGGISGMSSAIAQKAQKNFSTQQGRLQANANLQGQMMTNQNLQTSAANAIALQNAQTGISSSLNQLQLAANNANYQTVSGLMTGAGALGGAMYANNSPSTQNPYDQSGSPNTAAQNNTINSINSTSDYGGTQSDFSPSYGETQTA